ncbi:MAG: pyruvate formate-lyase [Clostridiales bacterium]|nr:pyruvate formate-lyase [Clostridiales bacterium]
MMNHVLNFRIEKMKKRLLETKPSVSSERLRLATEAYQKYAGEAIPLFRAHVFAYVLDHMTVVIREGELLVGSCNKRVRSASIFPEYTGQWLAERNADGVLNLDHLCERSTDPMVVFPEEREEILETLAWWKGRSLEEYIEENMPEDIQEARKAGIIAVGCRSLPSGKTVPDYALMMQRGLKAYIQMCRDKIAETTERTVLVQPKIDFWMAGIVACEAVIRFANRYADEAERMASEEDDEQRRKELQEIAESCRRVPENPPRNFREAMQFEWFIYYLLYVDNNCSACGFGRFDMIMGPYYERDLKEGRITEEEAIEWMECLFIKATEIVQVRPDDYSRDFAGFPLWQILMLGGVDRQGKDVTNAVTLLVLEAASRIKLAQPAVALRVHDGTPKHIWRKACEMIQDGQANPAFFGDPCGIQTVINKGGSLEDARDWVILGCVEPHQGGGGTDGNPSAGYLNLPKCLELVMHNGIDPLTGKQLGPKTGELSEFQTFEDVMEATKKQIDYWYDMIRRGFNTVISFHSTRLPCIYSSVLIKGCIEKGMPVQHGGAEHTYTGIFATGPASLADALMAVKRFVYQDKKLSISELVQALDANFEGYERLRLELVNKAPKYGNDNEEVDNICDDIVSHIAKYVQEFTDARGGKYCFCNQAQTVNLTMGYKVGATADGRYAFTALSDNAGPAMGRDCDGPTAAINSMSKHMHQDQVYDGTLVNLRFDPSGVAGEKGLEIIESLIREYVAGNGLHIQINVVDDKTLRAAQKDPENYRDIVVRVAGYMAYFTELDKTVQDVIIARTAHLA